MFEKLGCNTSYAMLYVVYISSSLAHYIDDYCSIILQTTCLQSVYTGLAKCLVSAHSGSKLTSFETLASDTLTDGTPRLGMFPVTCQLLSH